MKEWLQRWLQRWLCSTTHGFLCRCSIDHRAAFGTTPEVARSTFHSKFKPWPLSVTSTPPSSASMAKGSTPAPKKKRPSAASASAAAKKSNTTPPKRPPRPRASTSTATAVKKTLAPDLPTPDPTPAPAPLPPKTLASISDLRELVASGIDTFKRRLDTVHSDAVKEINASVSNVSKRFKSQTQAWQQLSEESEKEYKIASDKINGTAEMVKGTFGELISKAQAETTRVRKVSIPELEKSMEKAVGYLRSQYKIPAITA